MKYPKRSQYKYAKSRYRVRNWRTYEAGLRSRGDLGGICPQFGAMHQRLLDITARRCYVEYDI